ncbi:MAG TPA: response regulator [Burkholderiales bacterium]|nr:response regulator [Burkholderiales bacterium]
MRLLIVEDDAMLADGLVRSLRRGGHTVDSVDTAERGWLAMQNEAFDLMILDLGLPGSDGFDLLRRLRRADNYVPVIVVTAREAVADRVRGLDLGADDYLVKPFAVEELEARVRALIRRRSVGTPPELRCGDLVLDLSTREARVGGVPVELTVREWTILELLATQPGVALAKSRIVQSLSRWDDPLSQNAVEVHVSRLRAKIEGCGARIRTVRGFGYLLELPGAP